MHPWRLRLLNIWNAFKLQSYRPVINETVDREGLLRDIAAVLRQPQSRIAALWSDYAALMAAKSHIECLGQVGTLSSEEAFVIHCAAALYAPPNIIEIGTHEGKSTRRILDSIQRLQLSTTVTCYDIEDRVRHFRQDEARLILRDVATAVENAVLDRYEPGIIYLDAHPWQLLTKVMSAVLKREDWILAIHDCSPILCNPNMTISREEPRLISARTGHWERYALAAVFGLKDPLDDRLNDMETETHILRVFGTQHGLGLILPKALLPA